MKRLNLIIFTVVISFSMLGCSSSYEDTWFEAMLETQDNTVYYNSFGDDKYGYIETNYHFDKVESINNNPVYCCSDEGITVYFDSLSDGKDYISSTFNKDSEIDSIEGERKSKNQSPFTIDFLNDLLSKGFEVERAGLRDGTMGYLASLQNSSVDNSFMSGIGEGKNYYFVTDNNDLILVNCEDEEIALELIRNYTK